MVFLTASVTSIGEPVYLHAELRVPEQGLPVEGPGQGVAPGVDPATGADSSPHRPTGSTYRGQVRWLGLCVREMQRDAERCREMQRDAEGSAYFFIFIMFYN